MSRSEARLLNIVNIAIQNLFILSTKQIKNFIEVDTHNIIQLLTFQLVYMLWYAPEKLIETEAVVEVNILFSDAYHIIYTSCKGH